MILIVPVILHRQRRTLRVSKLVIHVPLVLHGQMRTVMVSKLIIVLMLIRWLIWSRWIWRSTIMRALPMEILSILLIDRCMMLEYRVLPAWLIIGI